MIQVPSYEEFQQLVADVALLKEENDFLRTVVLAKQTLTRHQVKKVLDISETTLWRLTKANTLLVTQEGKNHVYDLESVRSYLMGKRLPKKVTENRIIAALHAY